MRTFSQKPAEVSRKWYVIDASSAPLGRVATAASALLIGKGKPSLTAHVDGGDFVIIINAGSLVTTGNKQETKIYHNYSGYPSGLRSRKLKDTPATEAIYKAVRGMLPVNKLRSGRLKRLKIYGGPEHNHTAQAPELFAINMKVNK